MRAGALAASLRAFTAERAPVGVVAALAVALSAGPWGAAGGGAATLLRSAAAVFLVLLSLRIADDLRSVEHDRVAHPDRALPSGRIAARPLAAGAAGLYATAALVGGARLAPGLALLAASYALYFAAAERLPVVLRPPLANAVFLAIPPGIGLLAAGAAGAVATTPGGASGGSAQLLLALFFWLSAVGHDYAHEVHAAGETPPGPPTISTSIGPRAAAILGLGCYGAACAAGWLVAGAARAPDGWPRLYVAGLVAMSGYVGIRLASLIAEPSRERARRLYAGGIACFALPSLLLGLDRILGW